MKILWQNLSGAPGLQGPGDDDHYFGALSVLQSSAFGIEKRADEEPGNSASRPNSTMRWRRSRARFRPSFNRQSGCRQQPADRYGSTKRTAEKHRGLIVCLLSK